MDKASLLYQFFTGVLVELGESNAWIDECSQTLPDLETAAKKEETEKKGEQEAEKPKSTFEKIMPFLGKAIDFICGFKDQIKTYLNNQFKRYIRLFIQGKTRRRFVVDTSKLWESVKEKAQAFGEKIKSGAASVGSTIISGVNFVCKTIDDIAKFLKEQMQTTFKPIIDLWEEMKKEFIQFLTENPLVKAFLLLVQCLYKNQKAIAKTAFLTPIKNFEARIKTLSNTEGWINFTVDAVCSWSDLLEAIEYLKSGWSSTDKKIKYNYLGKFFGKLIVTLQLEQEKKR